MHLGRFVVLLQDRPIPCCFLYKILKFLHKLSCHSAFFTVWSDPVITLKCQLWFRKEVLASIARGFSQFFCFLAGANSGCRTFKMGFCRPHSWLGFWWHLLYLHIFRRRKCTSLNYIICIVCGLPKLNDVHNFKLWRLGCLTSAFWILHQIVESCLQFVRLTGWYA